MSQTTALPGAPGATPADWLASFFLAMHKGAELVYHEVVAVETVVTAWRTDNPAVAALIQQGVTLGSAFLSAHGLPVADAALAAQAVVATLRGMASNDTSVPSVPQPAAAGSVA